MRHLMTRAFEVCKFRHPITQHPIRQPVPPRDRLPDFVFIYSHGLSRFEVSRCAVGESFGQCGLLNNLSVFGLPDCDIYNERALRRKWAIFGDTSKVVTINSLNFIDKNLGPKMNLKGPERACKKATVGAQLWPFQLSSVALSQV